VAAVEGLVTGALAAYLEANRDELNDRARDLPDPSVFAGAVTTLAAPIVAAVEERGDGFAGAVAQTVVDVALELCVDRRMDGAIRDGWSALLPQLPRHLSAAPRRVVASATNALANLERAGRPAEWIERMQALALCCSDVDELLVAGQVAAWRSGMAAYRVQAQELAAGLSADARAAAGVEGVDPLRLPGPVRVGAFRGFGGAFMRPPTVTVADGRVLATDGEGVWEVFADAFGTAVMRTHATVPPPLPVDPPEALAGIADLTSWADSPVGLVGTTALSHAVLFIGR
jgi:hypothetical protein